MVFNLDIGLAYLRMIFCVVPRSFIFATIERARVTSRSI